MGADKPNSPLKDHRDNGFIDKDAPFSLERQPEAEESTTMEDGADEIAGCLLSGGIVLIPTDTVYGLAVSPGFQESVDRLYALKCRPRNLNLPIMVSSADDLELLGLDINDRVRKLLLSPFVPGALTIAMGFTDRPLVPWLADREEVAVRIPDDRRMLSVLRRSGPLLVTSANRHGVPPCKSVQEILAQLEGKPDLVIDGGILDTVSSTIVNCRHDPPEIEREGCISRTRLLEYLA